MAPVWNDRGSRLRHSIRMPAKVACSVARTSMCPSRLCDRRRRQIQYGLPGVGRYCLREAARGQYDAVIAMYHDQRHIPGQVARLRGRSRHQPLAGAFWRDITLRLPIIRSSVSDGTTFAGKGIANEPV